MLSNLRGALKGSNDSSSFSRPTKTFLRKFLWCFASVRSAGSMRQINRFRLSVICTVLSSLLVVNPVLGLTASANLDQGTMPRPAMEAAVVLGVDDDVRSVLALGEQIKQGGNDADRRNLLVKKSVILKRILLGNLEVREASDVIDEDLGNTYDQIDKESRKRDHLVTLCNVANFTQFGVQFALAAAFRLKEMGLESSILVETTAAGTLGFSTLALLAARTGKSREKVRQTRWRIFSISVCHKNTDCLKWYRNLSTLPRLARLKRESSSK